MSISAFELVLLVVVVVALLWLLRKSCSRDNYQYLDTYFRPEPSVRMEYQDVCEKNPLGHCNLSDGSPGHCVRNGMCARSFLLDPSLYYDGLPARIPLPYSERDCAVYCENQRLFLGDNYDHQECMDCCRSKYYPDDY